MKKLLLIALLPILSSCLNTSSNTGEESILDTTEVSETETLDSIIMDNDTIDNDTLI